MKTTTEAEAGKTTSAYQWLDAWLRQCRPVLRQRAEILRKHLERGARRTRRRFALNIFNGYTGAVESLFTVLGGQLSAIVNEEHAHTYRIMEQSLSAINRLRDGLNDAMAYAGKNVQAEVTKLLKEMTVADVPLFVALIHSVDSTTGKVLSKHTLARQMKMKWQNYAYHEKQFKKRNPKAWIIIESHRKGRRDKDLTLPQEQQTARAKFTKHIDREDDD